MSKQFIAVGSKRGPKLQAVADALTTFGDLLGAGAQFEAIGFEVASGVRDTPVSAGESMQGARQRTDQLIRRARENRESYPYYVGLEGGLDVIKEGSCRVFLESWAYVSDGSVGYFGRSGGIEIPQALAGEVLENGVDLSMAIDKYAGMAGIRDNQGAWGVLSRDLISRREAFRIAVIAAFAPFYNAKMYESRRMDSSQAHG